MALYGAILTRNEASLDRYLRSCLASMEGWADKILVLDDGSTDETVEICEGFGAMVKRRELSVPAWGAEASARRELWEFAVEQCSSPRDWVVWADADMLLHGDPRPLCGSRDVNSWLWRLYDVWDDPSTYRSDQFWRGHTVPRCWMCAPLRVPNGWQPSWDRDGLHVGHIPASYPLMPGLAPDDVYYLHLGWMQEKHRLAKYEQYMAKKHLLSPPEVAHVESILSPA